MAETILTSPGVSTREIDLSGPSNSRPFGVPAGVIGTANRGPAFVPVTFGSRADFFAKFGETDGEKFGPIAISEWMSNGATAGAYMRVLGAGNGKQRNTTSGIVTNAGFIVGNEEIQSNGLVGRNPYANDMGIPGNVHFLAAFMSQSNSSIFVDAGLVQDGETKATPILRGVLMAPSGVVLSLSGVHTANSNMPLSTTVAAATPNFGQITGSLNISGSQSSFVMLLNGHKGTADNPRIITASLNPTDSDYFANVMNRDPSKVQEKGHLVYTHYPVYDTEAVYTGSGVVATNAFALSNADSELFEDIVLLTTGSADLGAGSSTKPDYRNFQNRFTTSTSPWVISEASTNLFKVTGLDDGQIVSSSPKAIDIPGSNDRYKISVLNIKKSTSTTDLYGTFDMVVRDFYDTDENPMVLESFRGLSLDPASDRYIARAVGDLRTYFDFDKPDDEQRLVVEGSFPNVSNYVRVQMSSEMTAGDVAAESLPVGFRGPTHLVLSGTAALVGLSSSLYVVPQTAASNGVSAMINELPVPMRENLVKGVLDSATERVEKSLYWGVQFERKSVANETNNSQLPNPALASMTSFFPDFRLNSLNVATGSNPGAARQDGGIMDCDLYNNNKFSLLNIRVLTGSNGKVNVNTSVDWRYMRRGGITPNAANKTRALSFETDFGVGGISQYLKFSFFVQSGFNGLDMFNEDKVKMNNNAVRREMLDTANESQESSSTVAAYLKALDIMGRTSDVEIQLLAIPGIRESVVTDEAINTVENRFDALYLMDIQERDNLNQVITSSLQQPHVQNTVTAFTDRALDTSFAAAYFPNVTIIDPVKLSNVEVPPSVAVLGAFAKNDRLAHPWFAPAGFSRATLSTTQDVSVWINQDNADRLYEADINPLRRFVGANAGIVVFGQKTLQQAQSALDRINVRRLLIEIRRQVRAIANRFLFEPNRDTTLAAFSAAVQPLLQRVQQQQGVDRFKVLIDTTTTTQADVENNTIRGKIFLQPTRSVEFVSLDFVVTNAGAEE